MPIRSPLLNPTPPVPGVADATTDSVRECSRLSPVPSTESVRSYWRLAQSARHTDQLGPRRDPELQVGGGDVTFHRPLTDVQPVTDLGRRVCAGGEACDFEFAAGERDDWLPVFIRGNEADNGRAWHIGGIQPDDGAEGERRNGNEQEGQPVCGLDQPRGREEHGDGTH